MARIFISSSIQNHVSEEGNMAAVFANINWLAVVAATVVNMVLGTVWYMPAVFGNAWMKELGKTREQLGNPGPAYALMLIGSFVQATVLAALVTALQGFAKTSGPADGAMIGLVTGIGFVATTFLGEAVFSGKSAKLYLINVGYYLVALVINGALLAAWK
jgi:hypothetical protein